MKKTVKGLIIAASVAAVVGVGAVSFAKWEGSNKTSVATETSSTGSVSVIGFGNDTTIGKQEKLMPWDQPTTNLNGGKTVAHYTLPTVESGAVGYTITVAADKKDSWTGALYVIVDGVADTAASDPTATGDTNKWKEIGSASVFEFEATKGTEKQLYAHVILKSDSAVDMNQKFDLTFTLAEKTTE